MGEKEEKEKVTTSLSLLMEKSKKATRVTALLKLPRKLPSLLKQEPTRRKKRRSSRTTPLPALGVGGRLTTLQAFGAGGRRTMPPQQGLGTMPPALGTMEKEEKEEKEKVTTSLSLLMEKS